MLVISTYPKEASPDSKQWLYSGDDSGVLRVYNFDKYKKFEEIHVIMCNNGKKILSAIIFEDRFNEIANANSDENVYVMISFFDENLPIRIYRFKKFEKGQLIREIKNPVNRFCFTLNFYHDKSVSKSFFFMGFSSSFIKIYDLKSNDWLAQQFESKNAVTSINFIFRKTVKQEKMERILIYTQRNNNLIMMANIDTGAIMKQNALPKINHICDLCVWDDNVNNYLIVATREQNSIKILNFDLDVLKSIETGNFSWPINLLKVFLKDQKTEKIKTCFVSLQYPEKNIMFYQ